MTSDCLADMLTELARTIPAPYQADEWASWEASVGQTIAALSPREKQWQAIDHVAKCMEGPGMPLYVAKLRVINAMLMQMGQVNHG